MTQRFLPYSPDRDIYRLLQVDPRAGNDEILDAWRRLARTFHPDRNGSRRATEEMQVVNAVRQLVTDPAAKAEYDRERQRWLAGVLNRARRGASAGLAPARQRPAALTDAAETGASRMARAVASGLRAFGEELLPARCERCNGTIGRRDARCWICGFPTSNPREIASR
jgi:curved DNA-binding protein CbpA